MQEADLWQAVLGEIELSVSRPTYMTWFKNTRLLRVSDDKAVIGVPNVFIKQQLDRKYTKYIAELLEKNGAEPNEIEFKIYAGLGSKKKPVDEVVVLSDTTANTQAATAAPVTDGANSVRHSYRQGLNERYTFDNFVVGEGNELAYAACQGIASSPGSKYNPLFLYGGVGIGKTHLIQAVGNAIQARNPKARVVYANTEQFVQEFVDALRYKKNTDFANQYRSADVLIVDDIQFLANKEKVQDEFFHTFNALHQTNKQIILSSDKLPSEIPSLEERLRSRFVWGMTIDMQNPDFETRCAIVQTKASQHDIVLPTDLVEYLASHFPSNIRELEGALNKLLAFCEMHGVEPTLEVGVTQVGNGKTRPKHLSAKQIVERTAKHFQISIEDITGPKRDKDIVVPRQVAMYMLRSELHLSFPKIARELGRKDHTTAIHSVDKIEKEKAYDSDLRMAVDEIKERLYA